MLASAPDSMPVWRLNGASAWEQTATAQRVGDEYCFFVTVLGSINCDLFGRSALLSGKVCDGSNPARDAEVRIGQLATQTDDKGEYAVLVQSDVVLMLQTDFGSASAGPLTAASTNAVDVGCPSGADAGADAEPDAPPDDGGGGTPCNQTPYNPGETVFCSCDKGATGTCQSSCCSTIDQGKYCVCWRDEVVQTFGTCAALLADAEKNKVFMGPITQVSTCPQ